MADLTANLDLEKPTVDGDDDLWGGMLNADLDVIDGVFAPLGDGRSVGLHVGTNKTLDATDGIVRVTGSRFVLSDDADPTKRARIRLDHLEPGVDPDDYHLPAAVGSDNEIVTRGAIQNLARKTIVDPPTGSNTQDIVSARYVKQAIDAAIAAAVAELPEFPTIFETGDIIASAVTSKVGWVRLDGKTIGKGGSGATGLADASAHDLFLFFWEINSFGWDYVNPGRGAGAQEDWNSGKTITLPNASGHALVGLHAGLGMPLLFDKIGAATHELSTAEMPAHRHDVSNPITKEVTAVEAPNPPIPGGVVGTYYKLQQTEVAGGGDPHNNMQPSMGIIYWIKL